MAFSLDTRIPLSVQAPTFSFTDIARDHQQRQLQEENAAALREQRETLAQQRRQQIAEGQRKEMEDAALMALYQQKPIDQIKPSDFYSVLRPERAKTQWDAVRSMRKEKFEDEAELKGAAAVEINGVLDAPEPLRQAAYDVVRNRWIQRGLSQEMLPEQYEEGFAKNVLKWAMDPKAVWEAQNPKLMAHDPSKALVNPATGETVVKPDEQAVAGDLSRSDLRIQAAAALRRGDTEEYKRILKAAEDVGKADDRAFRPPVPIILQGPGGAYAVDRTTNQASAVLGPDGKPLGAPPTATEKDRAATLNRAQPVLDSIAELSERINTQQGVIARISGAAEKAKAQANLSDDVSEYDALVQMFTPMLARMVGHVGVLTEQDVQSVRAGIPKPTDSKSVRDRKIARIMKILGAQGANTEPKDDKGTDPLGIRK